MTSRSREGKGWWGSFKLRPQQTGRWRIGPLQLTVYRAEREWRIGSEWSEDTEEPSKWEVDLEAPRPETGDGLERFVFRRTAEPLRLRPALADRPVVTSPRMPLFLLPQEKTTLYVGSPLWVRIEVGERARLLKEVPIWRPSDTWFGPSTREGEVCYAARTRAALEVQNLPVLWRRAVTPLSIRNRAEVPLRVDRVKLPVPYLSVFSSDSGLLWTESVVMDRETEGEMASLEVGTSPPSEAGKVKLLTEARQTAEQGLLIRAFSTLFRSQGEEDRG